MITVLIFHEKNAQNLISKYKKICFLEIIDMRGFLRVLSGFLGVS